MSGREKLEQLRAEHRECPNGSDCDSHCKRVPHCFDCGEELPCGASRLIAALDEAREVVDAIETAACDYLYCGEGEWESSRRALLNSMDQWDRVLSKLEDRERR